MNGNPFMGPIFWMVKWAVVLCFILIAIAAIPVLIADKLGPLGVILFFLAIGAGIFVWMKNRMPTRKREF